jgi:hypothetical protein
MSQWKFPSPEGVKKNIKAVYTDKEGVTVVFKQGLVQPFCTILHNKMQVFLPEPIATELSDVLIWEWHAHHEGSHGFPRLRFTFDVLPKLKTNLEKMISNILADNLCERYQNGVYLGRDGILYRGRYAMASKHHGEILLQREIPTQAMYIWDFEDRYKWQGSYPQMPVDNQAIQLKAKLDPLDLSSEMERMIELSDVDEYYDLIQKIVKVFGDDGSASDSLESGDGKGEADGEGEEVDSDGTGSGSASDSDSGDGAGSSDSSDDDDGDSEGSASASDEGDEGNKGATGDRVEKRDQTERSDSNGESEAEAEATQATGGGWGTGNDLESVDLLDDLQEMQYDRNPRREETYDRTPYISNGKYEWVKPDTSSMRDSRREWITTQVGKSTVSKKIRKYLKIMSKDSYSYGQTKGKIHGKNLHRLYHGSDNPKIFKKKIQHKLKSDTAVMLLMDCSGSMSTFKYNLAASCLTAISITLSELRIPHELLGFTDNAKVVTYEFKSFAERVTRDKLIERFSAMNIRQNSNADGESVIIAATRLMARKEKQKVMFVLSDGMPASYGHGDDQWYLKQVCEMIEEKSPIDLYGIGVKTDAVQHFYRQHQVVDDITELDGILLKALKDKLI